MTRGQPATCAGAITRATLIVGVRVTTISWPEGQGDLSPAYANRVACDGAAVTALVALVLSGGVEPRRQRKPGSARDGERQP